MPGVVGDTDVLYRWTNTNGLVFFDACLADAAFSYELPIFTKSLRELKTQGAFVPDPLPR
jgi:hypothetical protein